MMRYLKSKSHNPHHNLAVEQVIFDLLDRRCTYFFLWQNRNTIVIGKNQNARAEINFDYVRANGVTVARRLSGGGAVYHDLGNVNFTFVSDGSSLDFRRFCAPVRDALCALGVPAEITGRNDMVAEGRKFSGNAMYQKDGRVMHHGTIMFDSNLDAVEASLVAAPDKLAAKGVPSVRSRVTNVKPYIQGNMDVNSFISYLETYMRAHFDMQDYTLSGAEEAQARQWQSEIYTTEGWIYGKAAAPNRRKRFDGVGSIEIQLETDPDERIKNIAFYGDFFFQKDPRELAQTLCGKRPRVEEIRALLRDTDVSAYFTNLSNERFIALLCDKILRE